ncbi:hypothetical protein [Streptomyces sp. NRRL F-5630]|uniref:hypothetical protein n=1 Tax=Streptomyces sp. NRRL F-5630 TaxID=1463864 RepID=UPI003D74E2CF
MPLVTDSSPAPVTYRVKTSGGGSRSVTGVTTVEHTVDGWLRFLGNPGQGVLFAMPLAEVSRYGTALGD